jgi:2,3-bisphosphoglycerate-dependent phosphoglycerate mutase
MSKLYVIRHAATQQSASPAETWPLSAEGEAQAQALVGHPCWQEVTRIVSSPEEKALATVRPAAQAHGLALETHHDLRELQRSPLYLTNEGYQQTVQEVFAYPERSINQWESGSSVRSRMDGAISELCERYKHDTLAIVSHGLALSIWLAALRGEAQPSFEAWRSLGFCRVLTVELV